VGQGQGSQGNLANLELRHGFGAKFKAAAFYDFAHVTTFKNANFAGAPATNNYNLQGAGISLDWEGPGHLELKLIGARRLSAPPAAVVNNFANNSGVSRNRGWLVASVPF
jgi:hypothetical protein